MRLFDCITKTESTIIASQHLLLRHVGYLTLSSETFRPSGWLVGGWDKMVGERGTIKFGSLITLTMLTIPSTTTKDRYFISIHHRSYPILHAHMPVSYHAPPPIYRSSSWSLESSSSSALSIPKPKSSINSSMTSSIVREKTRRKRII